MILLILKVCFASYKDLLIVFLLCFFRNWTTCCKNRNRNTKSVRLLHNWYSDVCTFFVCHRNSWYGKNCYGFSNTNRKSNNSNIASNTFNSSHNDTNRKSNNVKTDNQSNDTNNVNVSCVLFIWSNRLRTLTLTVQSQILTTQERAMLLSRSDISKYSNWKMIFNTQTDSDSAAVFHSKCDGKSPVLVVVKSTYNYVFGGYSVIAFDSSDRCPADPSKKNWLFRVRYLRIGWNLDWLILCFLEWMDKH